jgi:uncharacterized protein (TIGR02266 family)
MKTAESFEAMEQRVDDRQEVRLAIFYGKQQHKVMTDYSVNLSSGGIFIETNNLLPKDESLFVEFMLPNKDYIISCRSRVAWTNKPEGEKASQLPSGMGLQFIDLPIEDVRTLRGYLDRTSVVPVW